jgi:hypothetical protein
MLIDTKHFPWAILTIGTGVMAVGLYKWLNYHYYPTGLTGGTTPGLWYGIAGSALMVYAGLLSGRRKLPGAWWLGSRKWWVRGHIWLGLLSVVFILCHSGFRWGGPLEKLLWVVFTLVIVTGILGLVLQNILPRMIMQRIPAEAPYEQIPHLCEVMCGKGDALIKTIWDINLEVSQAYLMHSQMGMGAKVQLQRFYEQHVRRFLLNGNDGSRLLSNALQAEGAFSRLRALPGLAEVTEQITTLETLCNERRQLLAQERLHNWLHAWLLLHVPLSVLLFLLGAAHAVAALYY